MQTGRVWYNLADSRDDVLAGTHIHIGDQAYVDFIGVRDAKALFKVQCGVAG